LQTKKVGNKLQKKVPESLKENTQYVMAFGLIATMLLVAGFPMFVIFFFAIFAYFLWKTFSQPSRTGTREIFEFYLSANEVLRDDERRWFGFEVQEVINRGERILQMMNGAPPLVYFTLGALYHEIGDYKSAVNHLGYIVENENADEQTYVYPSPELRNYVKILRKIEREPAEAPQTSAAIRALERARRNRGKAILENSRAELKLLNGKKRKAMAEQKKQIEKLAEVNQETAALQSAFHPSVVDEPEKKPEQNGAAFVEVSRIQNAIVENNHKEKNGNSNGDPFANRQSISEVLHDIYDKK
jgi:tetratricopeptide (TPR) repeat protein